MVGIWYKVFYTILKGKVGSVLGVNKITILYKALGIKLPGKCKQAVFLAPRVESTKIIYYKLGQLRELKILVSKLFCQF